VIRQIVATSQDGASMIDQDINDLHEFEQRIAEVGEIISSH
jgi:hypothetical protein